MKRQNTIPDIPTIVRQALHGRLSSLNFLLLLGFFSTIVLLYISLHVHFFSISQQIADSTDRLEMLRGRNVVLTASYNDLVSPERIIPIATGYGMRAGSPGEMTRLALYGRGGRVTREHLGLAKAATGGGTIAPEGASVEKR
ncbi:MAG: hypothetical protein JW876_05580 [Candidatus Krumholzibacteriota bacterium]|nr:hypothetical protein [Candidatus Krumholzibacteriota bacterium]